MRLGKEQAVGYVEDTEADSLPEQEITSDQSQWIQPSPVPEPALPTS